MTQRPISHTPILPHSHTAAELAPWAALALPVVLWLLVEAVRGLAATPTALPGVLLGRSLLLAFWTGLLALALAAPYALIAARGGRRSRWLRALAATPLLLSPYAAAIAWTLLLEPEGVLNA